MGQPNASMHAENAFLSPKLVDLFFRRGTGFQAKPIYAPSRYKIAYGGRGSSKSYGFASMAAVLGVETKLRILCVREYQISIKESIHRLMADRIEAMGLSRYYDIQQQGIYGTYGTEIIFAGIKTDPGKIKSTEGIDICLVEEAEKISEDSWRLLIPTIRKPGSEIWVCFNPRLEDDPTYKRFVLNDPPSMRRVKVNWSDNPWFPEALEIERQYSYSQIAKATDDDDRLQSQQDYQHIWEGECQKLSDAAIFQRRVVVEEFVDPPEDTRILLGVDWGFSVDPTVMIRCWTTTNPDNSEELWISHEAYGYRVELDNTSSLFDEIPGARKWPIKADGSRPESISHLARRGFRIDAADKWPGSVEDGIEHIKAFAKIHIHPRCKHLQEEVRLYRYKVDRITKEVLPIVVDRHNHGFDSVRYALSDFIQARGVAGQWAKLGKMP